MFKACYRATMMALLLGLILCAGYPALVTLVGQAFFPAQAAGGLVNRATKTVGAELIGQGFTRQDYFHPRPSAAGDKGYDAANSSASNLGPTNKKLADRVAAAVSDLRKAHPLMGQAPVPADLVTTSASGLDPHISPEGAQYQASRVAAARGMALLEVQQLIEAQTTPPFLGLIGEPVVNVLALNMALDDHQHKP